MNLGTEVLTIEDVAEELVGDLDTTDRLTCPRPMTMDPGPFPADALSETWQTNSTWSCKKPNRPPWGVRGGTLGPGSPAGEAFVIDNIRVTITKANQGRIEKSISSWRSPMARTSLILSGSALALGLSERSGFWFGDRLLCWICA